MSEPQEKDEMITITLTLRRDGSMVSVFVVKNENIAEGVRKTLGLGMLNRAMEVLGPDKIKEGTPL